jgi:creatinine amidohydrolase
MASKVVWGEMSLPELEEAAGRRAVVILVAGATEQHGPHLPVNTDTEIGYRIAVAAAARATEVPVLVVPPIWAGYSPTLLHFKGTISLRLQTFVELVREVCVSIARHGFVRQALLSSHKTNAPILSALIHELADDGVFAVHVAYWDLIASDARSLRESRLGGMGHACELETSLALYLFPKLVEMSRAVVEPVKPQTSLSPRDMFDPGVVSLTTDSSRSSQSGIMGDPTLASAAKGQMLFDAAVARLSSFLVEFSRLKMSYPGSRLKDEL